MKQRTQRRRIGAGGRTAAGIAVVAAVVMLAGCQTGAGSSGTTGTAASLAAHESAIKEAEASLAASEDDTVSGQANVGDATVLGDDAATSAVDSAAGSAPSTALAALSAIPVKGRASKTGYSREQFGAAWADVDHNGCDTRNDILNRDLTAKSWRDGTHGCVVIAGALNDPYTGKLIAFAKATAGAVQIDHVVALGDAWQKGAQGLDAGTRLRFANDPLNLLAVDGPANESKGDGDAATWLPPNKSFRCRYVARQVAVKARYGLWVTQAEHDAISRVLEGCPSEPVPSDGVVAPSVPPRTSVSPPPVSVP